MVQFLFPWMSTVHPIHRLNDWFRNPAMSTTKILVVDNYDSFVYTLVGYLQELGAETTVVRNDDVTLAEAIGDGRNARRRTDLARARQPCGGRCLHRADQVVRRQQQAHVRCLPGPPGPGRGLRRHRDPRTRADARQDLTGGAPRNQRLRRASPPPSPLRGTTRWPPSGTPSRRSWRSPPRRPPAW